MLFCVTFGWKTINHAVMHTFLISSWIHVATSVYSSLCLCSFDEYYPYPKSPEDCFIEQYNQELSDWFFPGDCLTKQSRTSFGLPVLCFLKSFKRTHAFLSKLENSIYFSFIGICFNVGYYLNFKAINIVRVEKPDIVEIIMWRGEGRVRGMWAGALGHARRI